MQKKSIAVIGGGMTGIAAALELAKSDKFDVTLFEQADHLGGLSDYYTWNGITWDRFYHVILSTDTVMLDFIREIGLEDQLFWRETKSGFYGNGQLVSMSTMMDFFKFPFLSLWQKFRLAVGILYISRINDPSKLDKIYVRPWLTTVFGRRVYEKIWDPLLRSKLGDAREKTSAAFIWATITRLYGVRSTANKKEKMGHVHGGYKTILDAAGKKLKQLGVKIILNSPVNKIEQINMYQPTELNPTNRTNETNETIQFNLPQTSNLKPPTFNRGNANNPNAQRLKPDADSASNLNPLAAKLHTTLQRDEVSLPSAKRPEPCACFDSNLQPQSPEGPASNRDPHSASPLQPTTNNQHLCVHTNGANHFFNKLLLTVSSPALMEILESHSSDNYWTRLKKVEYLGVICCLLILKRKLSPYYVINLLDEELGFTGIIEATNIVSPDNLDDKHLVYLPKYVTADDPVNDLNDQEIGELFIAKLKKVYPDLKNDEILQSYMSRERYVQPIQELSYLDRKSGFETPIKDLYLVNTSMIYNSTLNNNAAITMAKKAAKIILNDTYFK